MARTPADVIYASELAEREHVSPLTVTYLYTRAPLSMTDDPPRSYAARISTAVIAATAFPPAANPAIFVCGPSGFVEAASDLLVAAGHAPGTIKTERFGPT